MPHVHFIGIGGVGMNGLAQLAVKSGYSVSGSDRAFDPQIEIFRILTDLGITFYPQNGSGISPETSQVVYSTAIESDNLDLTKAQELDIPLLHRAEFLKQLVGDAELIAVAGTAGKTTTTGLLGWIFDCLGKEPSVYNGAAVLNWKSDSSLGNIRKGLSNLWIIEADESDKSLLNFHPAHSIITNISKDHYELDELHRIFDQFKAQTSGHLIEGTTPIEFGEHPHTFLFKGLEFTVPMAGKHNLENALNAVRLCEKLGFNLKKVRDAVARFKGIERRLEITGTVDEITVIDDYAHNPVKIAAALSAAAEQSNRVHLFWRPHGFAPLFQFQDDLAAVFENHWKHNGGSIFILPVYYAGGTVTKKITAADFVERLNTDGVPAKLVENYTDLKQELEHVSVAGDTILGMGARDPELPIFSKELVSKWKTS
jgi:UDP-N-acetylmuramate--alanine ligase